MNKKIHHKGFIAITSIMIIISVVLVFLASIQTVSNIGLDGSLAEQLGNEASYIAESCLDDTLILLRSDTSYSGGNLNISDGFCTIAITDLSADTKEITIVANTISSYYHTVVATIQIIEGSETKQIILLSKIKS